MGERHKFAIAAVQSSNLHELAKYLSGATTDAEDHNIIPHMDPAVRLIAYHIAFTGNGDALTENNAFRRLYDICKREVEGSDPAVTKDIEDGTTLPTSH